MRIEKLEWDSSFFGYPVGKLILDNETRFDKVSFLNDSGEYKLVYIFSTYELNTEISSFYCVDVKITLKKNILVKTKTNQSFHCESYIYDEYSFKKLVILAYESGKYSRYRIDKKFINNEFEKLYRSWVFNSVKKKYAFEVLVYKVNSEIVGLITLTDKESTSSEIGLFAVSKEFQSQGIGTILLKDAELVSIRKNYENMQVNTQQDNINAMNFYKKNGFVLYSKYYIYHYWN
ncbi:MAG: GNAT family N-acetyltransferase [Bacteroidales bacterium]|nr:GNAT family N-acetyltransferase [Bacteroidales bacterium]